MEINIVSSKQNTIYNYKQNIFSTIPIPIKNNESFSSFSTFNNDDTRSQLSFKTPVCRKLLNDIWDNNSVP